jgi:hypothetical protein
MANIADDIEALRRAQYAFAKHLRDPAGAPAPADVEDRRINIYRRLFINNVTNFLKSTYKRTHELLGEERWRKLTRDYYRDHVSDAPLFPELPGAFLKYLTEERPTGKHSDEEPDPPWLTELAHYEWVETALRFADDPEMNPGINPEGDLLTQRPVVSKLAWLLRYQFPVDKISAAELPDEPTGQPYFYIAWRNADDEVKHVSINLVSARLFELIRDIPTDTGEQHLAKISAEMNHPDPNKIRESGLAILEQWRDKQILTGTLSQAS